MSSQLRQSISLSSSSSSYFITKTKPTITTSTPPPKRPKMTLTQTYYLAQMARAKLSKEAGRADHDLRLLVGHANLLDGLMLDLADAEREQESWFHHSVTSSTSSTSTTESDQKPTKHIHWADHSLPTVREEDSSDDEDEDNNDSDDEADDVYDHPLPLRKAPAPPLVITTITTAMDLDDEESDEEPDEEVDDEDDDAHLALHRTASRSSSTAAPELVHESDSDSEDEGMPPSPPVLDVPLDVFAAAKGQSGARFLSSSATVDGGHGNGKEDAFYDEGFYLPQRPVGVY